MGDLVDRLPDWLLRRPSLPSRDRGGLLEDDVDEIESHAGEVKTDGGGPESPWPSTPENARREFGPGDLVAVDFDGTLTKGEAKYWAGDVEQPREELVEWVKEQYYAGAHVVVWTARPWSQANVIAARLTEWGVPYHGIRCEKGGSDGYVDDKAARPSEVTGYAYEDEVTDAGD